MMGDSATGKVRYGQTVDAGRFITRIGHDGAIGIRVGSDFQIIGEQRMPAKVFWLLQSRHHFLF